MRLKIVMVAVIIAIAVFAGGVFVGIKHATTGDGLKVTNTVWSEDHAIDGDVLPDTDNSYDLGSPTKKFAEGHFTDVYADNFKTGSQTEATKFIWKDTSENAVTDLNRQVTLPYQDLDLTSYTSANAKMVYLKLSIKPDTVGTGNKVSISVRKNGTAPDQLPEFEITKNEAVAGVWQSTTVICGMDSNQTIEYAINPAAGWQIDTMIDVFAYWEQL